LKALAKQYNSKAMVTTGKKNRHNWRRIAYFIRQQYITFPWFFAFVVVHKLAFHDVMFSAHHSSEESECNHR
jgi:hypothetical protein